MPPATSTPNVGASGRTATPAEARPPRRRSPVLSSQFVILGAALNAVGHLDYVIDTMRGRCRPSIVTWTLWSFPPGIAFAAEIVAGSGPQALLTFALVLGPLSVLAACAVSRTAHWATAPVDWWCADAGCSRLEGVGAGLTRSAAG